MTRPPPLVLHTEASTGFGGQEIRILAETRWLLRHGWRALIAAQPASRLLAEATAAGLPAVGVRMRHALDLPALLALRRLMAGRGVDVVHTHSSVDSWVASLAARSLGLPVVRSRHVAIAVPRRRALPYHLADRIITSGDAVRQVLVAAGVAADRVVSVPPGVDTERFHPAVSGDAVRKELGLTGPVVGLVADLRGSKGHQYFLQAARLVRDARPQVRFLVVGDGVGRDRVRQLVADLGLGDVVVMTGFRHDIPEVMAALDVLTLPSIRSEATSQVIVQALAVGRPVVATTVGGSPELVRDGETGRLVPPRDAAALARAILDLLDAPAEARRLALAGQREVRARFSQDASMARTVAVYEAVRARGGGRGSAGSR
jgi:glycosyltransferase involved in cell wall biosynthesis